MGSLRLVWKYAAEGAVVALMTVMVVTLAIQVFFRFVIQDPPPWTEELARYAFVWITFLGAAVAYRRGTHIVVDTVLHLLSPRVRAVLAWVVDALVFISLVTLLITGIGIVQATSNVRATMLQIPMSFIYAAVPVSAALMLAYQAERLVGLLRRPAPVEG
jgi:TRAP-type C4-dicarboxylate transport system permease small subunit